MSIWLPRAPDGFVAVGCVAVAGYAEPELDSAYCVSADMAEETSFEERRVWTAPDSYPWACHIYQVRSEALHFVALRQQKEDSDWKPMRVLDRQSLEASSEFPRQSNVDNNAEKGSTSASLPHESQSKDENKTQ